MAEEVLQKSISLLREENSAKSDKIIDNTAKTKDGIDGLKNTMKSLLDFFRIEAGNKEEERIDPKAKSDKTSSPAVVTKSKKLRDEGLSILDILIGLPTALLGFTTGLAQGWAKAVGDVGKTIGKIVNATLRTILGGVKLILKIFASPFVFLTKPIADATRSFRADIVTKVRGIITSIKDIINVFKLDLTPLIDAFRRIPTAIRSATQTVINVLSVFKLDLKPLTNAFTNISNAFKAGMNGVQGLSRSVNGTFRSLNGLEKIFRSVGKSVKDVSTFVTATITVIGNRINAIRGAFAEVRTAFSSLSSLTTNVTTSINRIINPIRNTVNYLRTTMPGIFKAFRLLGRLLGWPLTIVIGLYEGIKASIASFRAGDILGGVMQFLTGAINGAVLSLVDMIKDGVSWIAAKIFGKDNPVTTFLDSFDFTEMFTNFMESYTQFLRSIPEKITAMVDGIREFVSGLTEVDPIGYLMEPIQQLIRDIKDFVLGLIPSIDDIKSIASGTFDSVKGFFGGKSEEDKEKEAAVYSEKIDQAEQKLAENPNDKDALIIKEKSQAALDKMDNRVEPFVYDPEKPIAGTENVKIGEKFTDQFGEERQYEYKVDPVVAAKIKKDNDEFFAEMDRLEGRPLRPNVTPRTANGQELSEKSKENALSSGVSVNVVNAPTSQNVTNNSQSTAAIMDKNMPTVDYNDRSWGYV